MKKFYLLTALFLPLALMAYHHEVNETSPKELVSQAYETFAEGDSTAWAKLHTADLSFTIFGDLPQSGIKIGADAVITGVFEVIPKNTGQSFNCLQSVQWLAVIKFLFTIK